MITKLYLLLCIFTNNLHFNVSELLLSHVIFSNGEHYFPQEEFLLHSEINALTKNGVQQAYNTGRFLRMWYKGFIKSQVYASSSNDDVSLETGQAVLAGLFPPTGNKVWKDDLLWQPFPLHEDDGIMIPGPCLAYEKHHLHLFNFSRNIGEIINREKDFISEMKQHLSLTGASSLEILVALTDVLSKKCHPNISQELPWITNSMIDKMVAITNSQYLLNYTNSELVFYKSGLFLQLIDNNTRDVIDHSSKRKMFLYSTQHSTIISLLSSLGVWNKLVPSCCSILMLEIHKASSNSFDVRILYKNDTISDWNRDPIKLQIPGCSRDCPFKNFTDIINPLLIQDKQSFNAICSNKHGKFQKTSHMGSLMVLGIATVVFLLSFCIFFLLIKRRNRNVMEHVQLVEVNE